MWLKRANVILTVHTQNEFPRNPPMQRQFRVSPDRWERNVFQSGPSILHTLRHAFNEKPKPTLVALVEMLSGMDERKRGRL